MTLDKKGRNPGAIARFWPSRIFLVALFLLAILLVFSATAASGHTKRDASLPGLSEATESRPDVNRQQSVVIDEDFENGAGRDVALSNGVSVVCEEGNCFVKQVATALQDASPSFNVGLKPWRDFTFKFRFNVRSNNGGPQVRWSTNVDGQYQLRPIGRSEFQFRALKMLGNNNIKDHVFNEIRSAYPVRQWNTLEVQAVGNRVRVLLNGIVVGDAIVPEEFLSLGGNASVSTPAAAGGDVEIWYDDLEVTLVNLLEPTSSPVRTPTRRPGTASGKLVIDEDFETGVLSGLRLYDGGIVACEEGNCFVKHLATNLPLSSPIMESSARYLQDYTVKFRFNVRSEKGGPTVKWLRTRDGEYQLRPIGQKGFQLLARKSTDGKFIADHRFDDIRSPYPVREWNTLELRTDGDQISVLLNGNLVANEFVPANFRSTAGPVAFFTVPVTVGSTPHDVEIWYDDIEVRLLNPLEPALTPGRVTGPSTSNTRPTPVPSSLPGLEPALTPGRVTGSSTSNTRPTPVPSSLPGSSLPISAATESSGNPKVAKEKSNRGFFTNTKPGESTFRANRLFDPTVLAVIGIMFTMSATMVQLFKGR